MTDRFLVGTRPSVLARTQTGLVVRALSRRRPGLRFEVRSIATTGDRQRRPEASPDFTGAIDRALKDGEVDLAVHSAKDLPLAPVPGLDLAACPRRVDPRDCLVVHRSADGRQLPRGARVGSSSPRRRAQLLRWRPDLEVVELRGNVDSRLGRVEAGEVDAAVLALAGLRRLGREGEVARVLSVREFLPSPGQGALAVMVRTTDPAARELARTVDDATTHAAVDAERAFALALGSDCELPVGALARALRGRLHLTGEVLAPDGRVRLRGEGSGPQEEARSVGEGLAKLLRDRGAGRLLRRRRAASPR